MKGTKTKAFIEKTLMQKGIPYLDICVSKGGETLFRDFYGEETTGKELLFMWSMSKPLTVVGVMKLVEEGKLSLDDPVEKYIPTYANTFLLDENGNRVPTKNKMTVRHLFTMSGGLTYNGGTDPILAVKAKKDACTLDFVKAFVETPLSFEPGERFQYSLCHDVLAAVAEVVSGKRFSQYMQDVLFAPLGMENTGYHLERTCAVKAQCRVSCDGEVKPTNDNNGLIFGDNYDSGGAGVLATVDDYVKFAKMLARGGVSVDGKRIIKEETLELIRSPQCAHMNVQNTFTCIQGDDYAYGLGMRTRKAPTAWGLPIGEYGWDGAAASYLMVDPVNGVSVVIGMNMLDWTNNFADGHLRIVEKVYADLHDEGIL